MGDNYANLRTDFCKWIENQATKAGSDIDAQELNQMTQSQIVSKYANKWQEYLETTNKASEEDFVTSAIDIENEDTSYLNNLVDDYTSGLDKDSFAFQSIDKNHDGTISKNEKVNFFESMNLYDNDAKNVSLADFTQAVNEFENQNVNEIKNNPFAQPLEEVQDAQETQEVPEVQDIQGADEVLMTGEEDFKPVNLFATGKEALEKELKNVNEQLDFYNKNSLAVSQVVEANKSVYEDAKTAYNEKKESLGKMSDNIVAIENEIPLVEADITEQEDALATNTNELNSLKSQLQNNDLSEENRTTLEKRVAELSQIVSEQEETIDDLYDKKQDVYDRLDAAILAEYGANSELYQASRLVTASYQEYNDIKSCQTRINAQIPTLEASREVLENRLEDFT